MVDFFVCFCEVLFRWYHEKVEYQILSNQINSLGGQGELASLSMVEDGHENWENAEYQATRHQFVTCAKATRLTHKTDAGMQIGMMLGDDALHPATCRPKDVLANIQRMQMSIYFYSDVLLHGGYPGYALRYSKDYQIQIHTKEEELRLLREHPANFLSFPYYFTRIVDTSQPQPKENPYLETSIWDQATSPLGFRSPLNQYWDRYRVPIFITESGLSAIDAVIGGHIHDGHRIVYLREHIKAMRETILGGVQVFGYTSWEPIDIISYSQGEMSKRCGYIYVGHDDRGNGSNTRIRKDSFTWYQHVVQTSGEEL